MFPEKEPVKMIENHKTEKMVVGFHEAMQKTGNGSYNILLTCTCALILLGIGVDLFGFSLVVTVACDLNLTIQEKGILNSVPYIGIILVSYIWGYVADTKGRRFTLMVSLQVGFVLSCISSFSPNWLLLAVIKLIAICFSCAANSVTYTMVGECLIERVRNQYMLVMTSFLLVSPALGAILSYPVLNYLKFRYAIPWLSTTYTPWRLLIVVLAIPSGVGGLLIMFFHESPKFLANIGKKEEALEALKCIYAFNYRKSKHEYQVQAIKLDEGFCTKKRPLLVALYEQSAPLFKRPFLFRTLQLFYIVAVVYITNNSFLVWLPHILNLMRQTDQTSQSTGGVCALISTEKQQEALNQSIAMKTDINEVVPSPTVPCLNYIENNVILTLIASQTTYAILNFVLSYFPNRRRIVLIAILSISSLSAILINLMPEIISSVFFFVLFTCTCLCMGILASYFVEIYPTSYRGMISCLSIMVGRCSTFVGINIVGNLIFNNCQLTFYLWALLVLSSAVAAWFLPPDKPQDPQQITRL